MRHLSFGRRIVPGCFGRKALDERRDDMESIYELHGSYNLCMNIHIPEGHHISNICQVTPRTIAPNQIPLGLCSEIHKVNPPIFPQSPLNAIRQRTCGSVLSNGFMAKMFRSQIKLRFESITIPRQGAVIQLHLANFLPSLRLFGIHDHHYLKQFFICFFQILPSAFG